MRKLMVPFLVGILVFSILVTPESHIFAQGITLPAQMNLAFSPISIPLGATSRLRVAIFNPNAFALTNASWSDNLVDNQPGLVIANPADVANTCGGSVTAAPGSATFSLSGGTVPAQSGPTPGSCSVTITVTSSTIGNLITTILAGALSASGGGTTITNTDPASATLHVGGVLPPSVSKSFNSATIWAGEVTQLSIGITNHDPTASLTQASITDDLPANVLLANPASPSLNDCGTAATVTAANGGGSVTLNDATIAPNSTCTITVNVTASVQGTYTNTIPANALHTQQGLTNTTQAFARLNVQEIGISKRFSPGSLAAGATTTLIITLQNPTSSPYTGAKVTDNLPAPLTIVQVAGNTCNGNVATTSTTISLTGGTIPAGSSASPGTCRISVDITAPAGTAAGSFRNTIPVGGLSTTQGVGNLRPANASVVVSSTELTGIKSFSPSTIQVGGNARLRIDIFAPSDTDLTNFSITDPLPAGVTVSNSTPSAVTGCGSTPPMAFTADTGGTSISLSGGTIPAGQRCRIDVYVTSSAAGLYTNTISPTNITNTENRTLTTDLTSSLTVGNASFQRIAIVKGFNPLTVFGGSASTMSIELLNPGTVAITDIAFSDHMPNGMILANPVNLNVGTCGGTLSGTPGANTFSFSGGSLPPQSNCTLTLSATMTVNGNLTNTIPAGAVTTANGVSNLDPAEATLTNLPGASISKFFLTNTIAPGSDAGLNITIQNTGNVALSGMGFSDSLPAGLTVSAASAPAPTNSCGGTLTAVSGTQLIELRDGALNANASCSIVVYVTGTTPGDYQNTIPAGSLTTNPNIGVTNSAAATDTLAIAGIPVTGGGGARKRNNAPTPTAVSTTTSGFIIPVTGFAPDMVTKLEASPRQAYEATSLMIEIPVIKVKTPIVGVESKNGGWDISWLQNQVGWLNGTAYPTWNGNSLLTGHVVNADGKPGVFYNLKALGLGEYIFVYNSGYRYTYKVVSNTFVQPDDRSVMQHEEKPTLTLITCDSYDQKTGTYLRRVVVRAELIDVQSVR